MKKGTERKNLNVELSLARAAGAGYDQYHFRVCDRSSGSVFFEARFSPVVLADLLSGRGIECEGLLIFHQLLGHKELVKTVYVQVPGVTSDNIEHLHERLLKTAEANHLGWVADRFEKRINHHKMKHEKGRQMYEVTLRSYMTEPELKQGPRGLDW